MNSLPNILITGTPGTGKTTLASKLSSVLNYDHYNLSDHVTKNGLFDTFDDQYNSYVFNYLSEAISKKNIILDYHECDFLKPEWFLIVVVLRADIEVLHNRYQARKYSEFKSSQNIESEIFQIILEQAVSHFGIGKIIELPSNSQLDFENNINLIHSKLKDSLLHKAQIKSQN